MWDISRCRSNIIMRVPVKIRSFTPVHDHPEDDKDDVPTGRHVVVEEDWEALLLLGGPQLDEASMVGVLAGFQTERLARHFTNHQKREGNRVGDLPHRPSGQFFCRLSAATGQQFWV